MDQVLVLIPARFASTRFPGKPLVSLLGKSLIQRVYENCQGTGISSKFQVRTVVVTDDDRIQKHVEEFGGEVCRVDDDVVSGSERIYLAYERHFARTNWNLIINVQGDEPLLKPKDLEKLCNFHLKSSFDIATIVRPMIDMSEKNNPNRVKAIRAFESGQCLYFSRAPIPYGKNEWHLHIGVYSYKPSSLESFFKLKPSKLELTEKLEQLRALEAGMKIGAIETNEILAGVDTPEDVRFIEGVLREQSN